MPDETVIEFAFLLLSRLSLCWFEFYFVVVGGGTEQQNTVPELIQTSRACREVQPHREVSKEGRGNVCRRLRAVSVTLHTPSSLEQCCSDGASQ